jgi:hypothetical protein
MMKKSALALGLFLGALSVAGAAESSEKETLLTYDDHHVISLGDHNHQEFFDMVQDLQNSTAVMFIYARKSVNTQCITISCYK